jgi:hypothetical protein
LFIHGTSLGKPDAHLRALLDRRHNNSAWQEVQL